MTNTRTFYDDENVKEYDIRSQQPIRYIMNPNTSTKYLEYPHQFSIDKDSKLRHAPTRLNYHDYESTSLYGTAPFKGRNDGPVDVESSLLHGTKQNDTCNRLLIETPIIKSGYVFDVLNTNIPLRVQGEELWKSTRNEYRNNCFRKSTQL
jgi:hypothetical protein